MWYVSIMSNRDLLARITTNKPGALALTCRVVLVAAAVLLVDFVVAEPLLAEPVRAKDDPKFQFSPRPSAWCVCSSASA